MYMNGAGISMVVTAVSLRQIRRGQTAARNVCFVAVAGTTMRPAAVSSIVAKVSRGVVATTLDFVSVIEFFLQDSIKPSFKSVRKNKIRGDARDAEDAGMREGRARGTFLKESSPSTPSKNFWEEVLL